MTATPPTPEQPGTPPAAPAYGAPVGTPGPKQGLSLTSFIMGLAGVVFCWIPVLGFLVSLAAVIIGFIAKGKEPAAPKWMWIVGVITGFVGILLGIIILLSWLIPLLIFGSALSQIPYY